MRIAVISDIHGNSAALDAVLGDIARLGITRIVNLGDVLSGPLDPEGVVDRLMGQDIPTVAGNHDRWLLDPPDPTPLWEVWARPELSAAHFDWVRSFPATLEVDGMLLTHGSPARDTDLWLHRREGVGDMRPATLWEIETYLGGHENPVILSGHTHMARAVRLPSGQLLLNPGSVGCPAYIDDRHTPAQYAEEGGADARYGIIEHVDGSWQGSLLGVPYDPTDMIARAEAKGAQSWVQALSTGWVRPKP